jgi:predicted O-methyltransferase YrrM
MEDIKIKIIKESCSCTYSWVVDWINSHLKELPKGAKFVELGTFVGGTTRLIALANPHIEIHTIDLYNLYDNNSHMIEYLESIYNLKNVNHDALHHIQRMHLEDFSNVFIHTGHSVTIPVTQFHASFIDAHHSYYSVIADLDFVWENTVEGGIIFGDDIDSPNVYNAVNHWTHRKSIEFTVFSKAFKIVKTVPKYVFGSQPQKSFN